MTRLRIVRPDDGDARVDFADAARAAMERALADGATVIMVAYETPTHWSVISVPPSDMLVTGFIRTMAKWSDEG